MSDAVNLETFGDLLKHGYKLAGHCRKCSIFKDIDLTKLPPKRPYVGARFKCRRCGGSVQVTLSQIQTGGENPAYDAALAKWRTP